MTAGGPLSTRPFTYDRADFVALASLHRPQAVTWLFRLAWVLFAVAFVLVAVCLLAGSTRILPFAAVLAVLLLLYLLLHRYGANLGGWALEKAGRSEGLLREQVMTAAGDCFRAESSRGKTEVRWSAVPRIEVEDDRLFVFSTRRTAFIVPRRAFASEAEFHDFARAAEERWHQRHRL